MSELTIEVEALPSGNLRPSMPAVPEQFKARAADIADSIAAVAEQFRARLEERIRHQAQPQAAGAMAGASEGEHHWGLNEVELSFQLALQVEGGVVIKSTGAATFGVKLLWKATGAGG